MVSKSFRDDHTNEPFPSDGRDIVQNNTFWVTGTEDGCVLYLPPGMANRQNGVAGTEDGSFFTCRRGWLGGKK